MRNFARVAIAVGILAVMLVLSDRADASPQGGISGTVRNPDGTPRAGLLIKLVQDVPMDMPRPGRPRQGGGAAGGTKVVAQATTDANGRFTFENVDPGQYRLEGGNNTIGWLVVEVQVEAGKTTDVGEQRLVKVSG